MSKLKFDYVTFYNLVSRTMGLLYLVISLVILHYWVDLSYWVAIGFLVAIKFAVARLEKMRRPDFVPHCLTIKPDLSKMLIDAGLIDPIDWDNLLRHAKDLDPSSAMGLVHEGLRGYALSRSEKTGEYVIHWPARQHYTSQIDLRIPLDFIESPSQNPSANPSFYFDSSSDNHFHMGIEVAASWWHEHKSKAIGGWIQVDEHDSGFTRLVFAILPGDTQPRFAQAFGGSLDNDSPLIPVFGWEVEKHWPRKLSGRGLDLFHPYAQISIDRLR